jgi:hypothetical protein
MHHPHQFNVLAKSIQDDRLRAAAVSRASKQDNAQQIPRRRRFSWFGWAAGRDWPKSWSTMMKRHWRTAGLKIETRFNF